MADRVRIEVRVIPRARETRVGGQREGRLLVRVSAGPHDGAANRALCAALATHLGVRSADVRIELGAAVRDKLVSVPATAAPRLAALLK